MTLNAGLDLQAAIYSALKNDATIQSLLGGNPPRIYQDVKADPAFPYITMGDDQEADDSVENLNASIIFADIHIWSRAAGYAECKRIGAAVRAVLHNAELSLAGTRCVEIRHLVTRNITDPDNITLHGIVTFRAETEE